MEVQYWQHKTSGEVYAVTVDDSGKVTQACGPLHHSEVTPENLAEYRFNSDPELVDDLNAWSDDYEVLEEG